MQLNTASSTQLNTASSKDSAVVESPALKRDCTLARRSKAVGEPAGVHARTEGWRGEEGVWGVACRHVSSGTSGLCPEPC